MALRYVQRYPLLPKAEWWKRYAENVELPSKPDDIIKIKKNIYLRKFKFDCTRESDRANGYTQLTSGMTTEVSDLILKTHNFHSAEDEPQHEDILFYQDQVWLVQKTSKSYLYTPKQQSVLHLFLKRLEGEKIC